MNEKVTRVGVGVFIFKDGKFLMLRRKGSHGSGTWSLPGGHLEFKETFNETVNREVLEETGLRVKNIRFGAVTNDYFKSDDRHYVTVWMLCDWRSGSARLMEPHASTAMEWHTFDDMPKKNLFMPCWANLFKSDFFANIRKLA
jgi:8-oxo-dGTP diphosphatase